ncbi:MAG: hypothetical protein ACYDG2_16900, partial [Ruminiclostridium sp.]
ASCFANVTNDMPEVKPLTEYITKGQWVDWAHLYWPLTVNNVDHRKAIQDFLAHKDAAKYWKAVDAVFEPARK